MTDKPSSQCASLTRFRTGGSFPVRLSPLDLPESFIRNYFGYAPAPARIERAITVELACGDIQSSDALALDTRERGYNRAGFIDIVQMEMAVPLDDDGYYICGSIPFMRMRHDVTTAPGMH